MLENKLEFDYSNLEAYSGYFLDDEKLKKCSSGGIATAMSEAIINKGGVVFGAAYSRDFKSAEYYCATTREDLEKLKGSKYIFTKKEVLINDKYVPVYPLVKKYLEEGKMVLFTGLGCDVAGLNTYLTKNKVDTTNLYVVDLICRGPTVAKVAKDYIERLEKKYYSKVVSFSARYKKNGWTPFYILVKFENGKTYKEDYYNSDYGLAFSRYSIPACYQCGFRGENHKSDVTIGDYHGITSQMKGFNSNGVSIIITQNKKGKELLELIDKEQFKMQKADLEWALSRNKMYYKHRDKYAKWDKFDKNFKKHGLHYAVVRDSGILKYYLRRLSGKMIELEHLPPILVEVLNKILHRQ